jgi:glycosyltransferase involved in cell wall biosynthesis
LTATVMRPRVLHIIPTLGVGGAQRTLATLLRIPDLESRVELSDSLSDSSISWSDIVLIHAWCGERDNANLNVPRILFDLHERPVILFNHDWRGCYRGLAELVIVYSAFAATNWTGAQPVTVLPGGITLERFSEVARRRDWSAPATIGRLSTLHPGKISPRTLHYWPVLSAKRFLVGGAGSQLTSLVQACTDPRFEFPGEVPPRFTHDLLSRIDIFLYDTEWHIESFCYVILEALAAGCVVVASNRGAIQELVETEKNGLLFEGSEEAVRLCASLLGDSERCRSLSSAGAATARLFPSEAMRHRFASHVVKVLEDWRK